MAITAPRAGNLQAAPVTGAVALVAGFLATWGQVHPTGYVAWDNLLVGVLAAGAVWAASRAPWWVLAVAAAAAGMATGRQQQWVLVAIAVGGIFFAVATLRVAIPALAAISAALTIAALCRLEGGLFFGSTAVFALALVTVMAIAGLLGQSQGFRRVALLGVGLVAMFMLVGAVGFGLAAWRSKTSISAGNHAAREGISALKAGDFSAAASLFHDASSSFAVAQDRLDQPWAVLGRMVPVVAQNRATAVDLVDSAAEVATRAEAAAHQIDPEALRVHAGAIDLAAVTALQQPVGDLRAAIVDLQTTLDAPTSGWVPSQVTDRLADVRDNVDAYRTQIDNLSLAVNAAPALLGADRPRHYFVAFSTPAEARSIGGFIGNYAVLNVDKGAISLGTFGRSDDLVAQAPAAGMKIDLPADFANRYGPFDFVHGPKGLVAPLAWKNIGLAPDFPTMTAVVAQMYKATAGATVDGMILMDPYPLAQLLAYTGPQTVPRISTPIDSTNAVDFILRKQYLELEHDDRVDLLDSLAQQTLDSLLSGALPSPITLAKDLGPFSREHRLMMWTTDPQEQALFDATGLSGRFPPTDGKADFGITFNNAAANKMEAYLTHTVTTTERTDPDLGARVVDVILTLTNNGPKTGLPPYVASNTSGFPAGTDYLFLSGYGPGIAVNTTRDGQPLPAESDQELKLGVSSMFVELEPGASTTITFTFEAPGPTPEGGWRVFVAPSAQRDTP